MADRIIKILTPASSYELLTLEELKAWMGIAPADTSQDAVLSQYIRSYSAAIATTCNRVFAYEEVRETWRCTGQPRIFLSRWPVKEADIASVECPRGRPLIVAGDYEIEEGSGKLEFFASYSEPIVVTYSGGYQLPDEAPQDLKEAAGLFIREAQAISQRMANGGIRSIVHKEARVMFFDPLLMLKQNIMTGGALSAANSLLMHYTRLEC